MLIAYVKVTIAQHDYQKALDVLLAEAPIVRAMPGCVTFSPLQDSTNEEVMFIYHEWEYEDNFAAYLSSSSFKEATSVLGPLFTAPPISRRFDAQLIQ